MALQFNWAAWDWAGWQANNYPLGSEGDGFNDDVVSFLGAVYEHVRTVANGEVGGGGSSLPGPVSLGGYLALTNVGASYDAIAQTRGLGFVEVDMTGVSSVVMMVQCNKVGTGVQRWQLWNETNGAEVGVILDSGSAGNHTLSQTFSGLALTGVKRLRVRALSSVAADDPVYYGASLRFA